ncbi:hypothetical protein CWS43_26105 [Rahnella sp. AA]|uniref:hypothetical protein n=1 Tax=Rahnella sp. AA TaxID=2057180 RepID=UPI000C33A8A6|nr:hypothetical protein [Rahnella sp. AA]PKE27600.1 hypothetical protein CWS43_26105 [Rahnella sp. AA]
MREISERGDMNKSIHKRFIRAWELRFRDICNSNTSQYWRKRDIKGFLRNTAIISADGLLYELAEDLAKQAFPGDSQGWTPEFGRWFSQATIREKFLKLAAMQANAVSDDDITDAIETEISYWDAA